MDDASCKCAGLQLDKVKECSINTDFKNRGYKGSGTKIQHKFELCIMHLFLCRCLFWVIEHQKFDCSLLLKKYSVGTIGTPHMNLFIVWTFIVKRKPLHKQLELSSNHFLYKLLFYGLWNNYELHPQPDQQNPSSPLFSLFSFSTLLPDGSLCVTLPPFHSLVFPH